MNLVEGRLVSGKAVVAPSSFELPYSGPAASVDGGGNKAHGNGDRRECVGVSCN